MPTYVYECAVCRHEFELVQRMSEAPIRQCPSCDGNTVHRKVTPAAFILKGGGWYADGYGRSSGAKSGGDTA